MLGATAAPTSGVRVYGTSAADYISENGRVGDQRPSGRTLGRRASLIRKAGDALRGGPVARVRYSLHQSVLRIGGFRCRGTASERAAEPAWQGPKRGAARTLAGGAPQPSAIRGVRWRIRNELESVPMDQRNSGRSRVDLWEHTAAAMACRE